MRDPPPEVRNSHLRMLLSALPSLGEPVARDVRAAVPPRTLLRIERASLLSWQPGELLVDLCEAAAGVVDAGTLERWGAAALVALAEAPLARAFFDAAARFHGTAAPETFLGYLTQAWRLLYSGCGELEILSARPGEVRILHAPVPPMLRRPATLLPLLGGLAAVPGLCGLEGRCEAEWDPRSPRFLYTVRFQPAAEHGGR